MPLNKKVFFPRNDTRGKPRNNISDYEAPSLCLPLPEFPVPVTYIDALIDSRYEHVRV